MMFIDDLIVYTDAILRREGEADGESEGAGAQALPFGRGED